mgnify:CR=1 FL=1
MITVKLTPHMKIEEVKWEEGMTVGDIFEKFRWTPSSVYVFVNGLPVSKDKKLKDGDTLILSPIVGGG